MKKIRLGFFVPELTNCGPINVVSEIIKHIDKSLFDIMIIVVRKHNLKDEKYAHDIIKNCNLGAVFLEDENIENTLNNISSNLDIVHLHGLYPAKYAKFFKNNMKIVATIHNTFFRDYISAYGLVKGGIGALLHLYYLNFNKIQFLVGCSDIVSNVVKRFTFRKKVVKTIHNGVDINRFYSLSRELIEVQRKKLGFEKEDILFIFSGALIRRKKVPELISWFKENSVENHKLIILGEGKELNKCENILSENVILLGFKSNPEIYYQISDFVVSMSSAEGYPMSIIEAVASGCYALLSANESHLEFIKHNPNNATLIKDVNTSLIEKKFVDSYSLSSSLMAEKYTNFYKFIVENNV